MNRCVLWIVPTEERDSAELLGEGFKARDDELRDLPCVLNNGEGEGVVFVFRGGRRGLSWVKKPSAAADLRQAETHLGWIARSSLTLGVKPPANEERLAKGTRDSQELHQTGERTRLMEDFRRC